VTELDTKLHSLNTIYGIWRFNNYLRVTYVSLGWLVVWDHRHSPPVRYDFREAGDHQAVCSLAAKQLRKLETGQQAEDNCMNNENYMDDDIYEGARNGL